MENEGKGVESSYAIKVLTWNERLLRISGIWPLQVRDSIFLIYFIYGCLITSASFLNLFDHLLDFDYIIINLVENILMSTTLMKMITCRINSRPIARFLKEIQQDFSDKNYRNTEERSIFYYYNKLSYRFIAITVSSMTLVLVSYFVREALTSVQSVMPNATFEYQLPYKIKPLIKPKNTMSFLLGCIYQSLSIPLIVSAYVGVDCLFASSALHITAQFAILKHRIAESLEDSERGLRKVILEHCRLIRLAETLEDNFTAIIFQQLLATTFQLCLAGYQMLVSLAKKEDDQVILFLIHACGLSTTLFVYCYIGEGLIQESMNLNEAFYNIKWYDTLSTNFKLIYICMMRTSKPLQLTSAKFRALSLYTFTDILKTSMGYLSVLRTFL
ncbi:PREDICTED: odorant receptor 47a-like [Polistes canadensis]|uniref:odorant receptor 47a-like n=1 Tax=Polistes canadensis TaxID=91411 RepID=UPI000718AE73|nr:PREDICTED: odorant receptor 47a-like [Polistes canadensis]